MTIDGGKIVAFLEMDTSKYGSAISAAVKQAGILKDAQASVTQKLQGLGKAATTVGTTFSQGVTAPIIDFGIAAVNSAMSAESAFAGVRKTVDASEAEYASLRQSLLSLSEEIPVSFGELSGIAEMAGQLGVGKDQLVTFTRTIADLGVATNLTGAEAATMLAQYANATGMDLGNIDRLGSVIVKLGNNVATTERDIANMAQRLSDTANILELNDAQTMGLAATMASLGIEAEAGGSAMSRTLATMQEAVLGGGEDLATFAKVAGTSGKEFAAAFRGDPIAALSMFVMGLGRIKDSGGDVYTTLEKVDLADIQVTETLLRMTGAQEALTENIEMANKAWEANNALTVEASKHYETTDSKLQLAKNSVENMMASLGELLLPVVKEVADGIGQAAKAINEMDGSTKGLVLTALGLVAAAGPLSLLFGGLVSLFTGPLGIAVAAVAAGAGIVALIGHINNLNRAEIDEDLENRFGKIKLSADEVDKVLSKEYKVIFNTEALTNAQSALSTTHAKVNELQSEIDKKMYLIKLGVIPPEDLLGTVEQLISQGQKHIDESKKTIKIEVETFFGAKSEKGEKIQQDLDSYFNDLQDAAEKKGQELWAEAKKRMADGELNESDLEVVEKMRAEYQEMLRLATLEDIDTKKRLFAYDAKNIPLTADSVKELARRAEEIHQAEIKAEESLWKSNRERTSNLYKDSPQHDEMVREVDQQHELNKITIAAANAEANINTYAEGAIGKYADEISNLQQVVSDKVEEATEAAKQAALDSITSQGMDLNSEEGKNAFRDYFNHFYQQQLSAMQLDISDALPDPAVAGSAAEMLGVLAPTIDSAKSAVAAMESLGANIPEDLKPKLERLKQFLEAVAGMEMIVKHPLAVIGQMSEGAFDQAEQALAEAQAAQAKARAEAEGNAAQAQAQAQGTPEGRAQAVLAELQKYADALNAGIEQYTESSWAMATRKMWSRGIDTQTDEGRAKFEEAFKTNIEAFTSSIDSLVPESVRAKAREAVQALMPDIQAAREQAAKMGGNISPRLQALLDMYDQIELLATSGSDLVKQLQDSVSGAASSGGSSAAAEMGTAITMEISGQLPAIRESGVNVGQGYVNGVLSMIAAAKAAGTALVNATKQGTKETAQISSPSKLFHLMGADTSGGFINGIISSLDRAYEAGAGLVDKTQEGMQNRPVTQSDWDKIVRAPKFDREKFIASMNPSLTEAEKQALEDAEKRYERWKAARRRAREAAELAAIQAHGRRMLAEEKAILDARQAQAEQAHAAMMATIGDYAKWFADTPLETALKASEDYYKAEKAKVDKEYEDWLNSHKKATKAQKEAAKEAHDARIAQLDEYAAAEQNQLRENYQIQQRIALDWIEQQRQAAHDALNAKREAASEEDYQAELAELQKRLRQSKSARERRELQEQIARMERDHAMDLEEKELARQDAAWAELQEAIRAGLVGLGDLLPGSGLPTVATGSAGLAALDIEPAILQTILASLAASTTLATNTSAGNRYEIDLRGAVIRSDDDIERIVDEFERRMRSELR